MENIVSAFVVGTCRILPKSSTNKRVFNVQLQDFKPSDEFYVTQCGSCAEFFTQPLRTCISDVDYMQMSPDMLAFTNEQPAIPYDFRHCADALRCVLMEPYIDYPAFVRLRLMGHMQYNWERKNYEFIQADVQTIIDTGEVTETDAESGFSGPACRSCLFDLTSHTYDIVGSIWCPQWPNEAKDWPLRRRKYGWPTTSIIHEVVQNGCHVVIAKHRACRDDREQWRLSFSVSEVILLKSWTPKQQIVYHMLRFFAKKELVQENCPKEDEVLCTYHFKTLMLWSCEKKSPEWWDSLSVIKLCCNLLKKLSKWLKRKRCLNYFIPRANLFHEHFNQKIADDTVEKLIYFSDSGNISRWFKDHYMQPSFLNATDAKCTRDVLSCEYLRQTCEYMKACYPRSIDRYISLRFSFYVIMALDSGQDGFDSKYEDVVDYCLRFCSLLGDQIDYMPTVDYESCYWFYGSMVRILCAASLLESKEEDYADDRCLVKIIRQVSRKEKHFSCKHHSSPRPLAADDNESHLYYLKARDLMENLNGSNEDSEFQVLSEISKRLFRLALECKDYERNPIANAAFAYVSALHFSASQYQTAVDFCSIVIEHYNIEEEETEPLNAGCLRFIEDISNIIGFYLIFLKTRDSLHYTRSQFFLDLRLTPKVFAQFLINSSIERTVRASGLKHIYQIPKFPLDAILIKTTNRKSSQRAQKRKHFYLTYQRTDPMKILLEMPNDRYLTNEAHVVQLLKQYSLDLLASFYNAICRDFDIDCSTVNCYRAAFLYECRKYSEVLNLCERILNEPALGIDLKKFAIANVMVLPPLDFYFDRDIRCLLGLHTLVCKFSPEGLTEMTVTVGETASPQTEFARAYFDSNRTLSSVLSKSYPEKCHYFLGKHFLARYLKVRCLIDCNHPISEAIIEFRKMKVCLPFETIIRCFLEKKLRQLQRVDDFKV